MSKPKKLIKQITNNNQLNFKDNFKKELSKKDTNSYDYRLFNLMVSKDSLKYIGD